MPEKRTPFGPQGRWERSYWTEYGKRSCDGLILGLLSRLPRCLRFTWRTEECHRCCPSGFRRCRLRRGTPFKFFRCPIPQRGMEPAPIVVVVDELLEMRG